MATTPNFALPYPIPTDTPDVPRDLQALAVKLDGTSLPSLQLRSEKGNANGYAGLDSTGRIPAAQLPSGVFVPLSAVGAAGGVASLDGSGKVPAAQLPAIGPTYGTTFPAGPADGQEHVLVDSALNPTYIWRFRYNALSTSPYKWECIGGAAVIVLSASTPLPNRAGDWDLTASGNFGGGGTTSGGDLGASIVIDPGTLIIAGQVQNAASTAASGSGTRGSVSLFIQGRANGIAAGSTLRIATATLNPSLSYLPVRLS